MKALLDTSVLVAAMVEAHPAHARALPWLQRAKEGRYDFLVSAHSLAETYAVLTALPLHPRIPPLTAWQLLQEDILSAATVVALSGHDYRACLPRLAQAGLPGGLVYDGLIAEAARRSGADRLITLNLTDFRRVWPEGSSRIGEP